jgi:hypothetical protein
MKACGILGIFFFSVGILNKIHVNEANSVLYESAVKQHSGICIHTNLFEYPLFLSIASR